MLLICSMYYGCCLRPQLLKDGYKLVAEKGYEVTDDVSIVEFLGAPVKITKVGVNSPTGMGNSPSDLRISPLGVPFLFNLSPDPSNK